MELNKYYNSMYKYSFKNLGGFDNAYKIKA